MVTIPSHAPHSTNLKSWSVAVHDAIQTCLTSDQGLGQVFASFSFVAISISSQGAKLNMTATAIERNARFAFSLFSLLSASSFLCAILATVLSQLVKRQLTLTQTKEDHTAHEFAGRFGLYIRLVGGLNSFAAIFLATAIFHFLLSIYRVHVGLAVVLASCWVIGGTLAVETFTSKFGLWTLAEVRSGARWPESETFARTPLLERVEGRVWARVLTGRGGWGCHFFFLHFLYARRFSTTSVK